jgi:hypothetical protein
LKNKSYQRFRTFVVYQGERMPLSVACERKGITANSLKWWRDQGFSTQDAFDMVVPMRMRKGNTRKGIDACRKMQTRQQQQTQTSM